MPKKMKNNDFQFILRRNLVVDNDRKKQCTLEIGFSVAESVSLNDDVTAAFRISPFDDWRHVHGIDLIQALELTIQFAQSEAANWGADWLDEDIETPMPDPG